MYSPRLIDQGHSLALGAKIGPWIFPRASLYGKTIMNSQPVQGWLLGGWPFSKGLFVCLFFNSYDITVQTDLSFDWSWVRLWLWNIGYAVSLTLLWIKLFFYVSITATIWNTWQADYNSSMDWLADLEQNGYSYVGEAGFNSPQLTKETGLGVTNGTGVKEHSVA